MAATMAMTRRSPAASVAGLVTATVLVAVALAGCVGIPTSGSVVAGPTIDDELAPDFVALPSGPRAGSPQEEILQDFILAANSPQNDYAIAKLFLTDALQQSWNPDKGVVVRTGTAPISSAGDNALEYSLTATAVVDENGRYRQESQPASQVRQFAFEQEGDEWRISEAPDGIVLSQNSFNAVFDEHALFFFDPTYQYLVPDVRWFPSRSTIPSRIVRALLAGPASWLQQGVVLNEFPTATALGSADVSIRSGTATVDLTDEARSAAPIQRERMRQQLIATLGTVSTGVSTVVITVGGLPLTIPEPTATAAVQNPTVESAPLVSQDGTFGFATGSGISTIPELSGNVTALGATAVTLAGDKSSATLLGGDGPVYVARTGDSAALAIDTRRGLVAPSVDLLGFVWSIPGSSAPAIMAFEFDGTVHEVASTLPADARLTSFDISRDGARILLYLQTDVGARLVLAGVIRQDNVPVGLGELVDLPIGQGIPVDAAWIDNRTVATISRVADLSLVTTFEIGGPSAALGEADGAVTIVGGNGGTDGIRVLADSRILRPQGSGGWQDTGLTASLLATQQ